MGYTRYWERTNEPITQEFLDDVNEILNNCKKKGIMIRNGWGDGEPEISLDAVCFNGDRSKGLDHEGFLINNEPSDFDFCKTARKPYDYAVRKVLTKAKEHGLVKNVRSDGANNKVISDAEYLGEDALSKNERAANAIVEKMPDFVNKDWMRKEVLDVLNRYV